MSQDKKKLIIISLFILLVIGIIVFVLVLKSKNNSKKKEEFDSSIIVSKRGINLDNSTVGTLTSNWLGNWPLTTEKINYVRTYGVSPPWVKWLEYLTDNSVYVFIGINSFNDIKTLIGILNKWSLERLQYIIGLSVANEPTGAQSEVQRVINTAKELRKQLTANTLDLEVPITACFVFDHDWINFDKKTLNHPEMYKFGGGPLDNVICFNIYGNLFGGTNGSSTPEKLTNSLDWSKGCQIPNQITTIRNAMKGSKMPPESQLWITEVGWTSEPIPKIKGHQNANATGTGWATKDTQKRFYNNFLTANSDIGADWPEYIFWFTVRDTRTSTKNESFGLLDSNGKSKFTGNLPTCGSSCDTSCQCPNGTVCDSGTCKNNSSGCYENDEDVFLDKCKKGLKCCEDSTFCRNSKYKYYCHKGNTCIPGDSKVDPGSSKFPQCPNGNCNVKDSKLCKYK